MTMMLTLALIAVALLGTGYAIYAWRKRRLLRYMPPEPAALRSDVEFWYYGIQPGEKNAGIKSNGMAPVYEALGRGILALRGKA